MRSVRTAKGKAIAFVNRGPNASANERLIIAAPQMLTVLERLLDSALPSSILRIPPYLVEAIKDVLREVAD